MSLHLFTVHRVSGTFRLLLSRFFCLVNSNDGKVIRYQPQLWQAFKSEVLAANPDALILSGDLSLNGEKANHLEFSEKLHEIEEAGVPVYVIPGNHDIKSRTPENTSGIREPMWRV